MFIEQILFGLAGCAVLFVLAIRTEVAERGKVACAKCATMGGTMRVHCNGCNGTGTGSGLWGSALPCERCHGRKVLEQPCDCCYGTK